MQAVDFEGEAKTDHWYSLSQIEVWATDQARAVVVIGDSITDGRGSTTNGNDRWPNQLARRMQSNPATAHVAVLNQGIGGNRVLRDGLGPSLVSRLERDVFALANVEWLVVFEGINDLGTAAQAREKGEAGATAADLIKAYKSIVAQAHQRSITVVGCTLLPYEGSFYFDEQGEADRQTVNAWIRDSGIFDAVIDFDAITRDPEAPTRLSPRFDGGDHLHPSAAGYTLMAESVDLSIFER